MLKNKLNELEVCHEKPMNDIYIIRSKIYSYKVNGKETKASVIYDCDNLSTKNVCLKDNRIDWDWTERIYPRSSSKLRRSLPESNQEMEFPFSVDGFELTSITLTYINTLGIKENKNVEYYKKSNNYAYAIVNIRNLFYENIIANDQFSNCWLVSIYKNPNGKYLKVIWYYAGSNFLEDMKNKNK
ncbi:hypothetical protein [Yokenella regensburgei]|uniref:hypothetical protein n=1 Tax=Yokenella regensburgei TaxID=158877 RepID=UPI003F5CF936